MERAFDRLTALDGPKNKSGLGAKLHRYCIAYLMALSCENGKDGRDARQRWPKAFNVLIQNG